MEEKYLPNDVLGMLAHVAEEANEVSAQCTALAAMCMKTVRFGFTSRWPLDGPTNRQQMVRLASQVEAEVTDLRIAYKRLIDTLSKSYHEREPAGFQPTGPFCHQDQLAFGEGGSLAAAGTSEWAKGNDR